MLTVIIVIHLMLVLGLIGVVLLQKSEGGGLVSSTSGFMTGRGTANVLTRTTALLAVGFFITSLALSWLAGLGRHPASIINTGGGSQTREAPPGSPAPLSSGGGVLDQLKSRGAPEAPAAPADRKCRDHSRLRAHGAASFPALIATAAGPASVRPEDFARPDWECGNFRLRTLPRAAAIPENRSSNRMIDDRG